MPGDLPTELRALVSFLEVDDRPTIIFRENTGETTTWELTYANKALLLKGDTAIQAATKFIQQARGHFAESQHSQRRPEWSERDVCEGFVAVIANFSPGSNDVNHETQVHLNESISATDTHEQPRKLDWIRYPSSETSKWQQLFLQHNWAKTPLGPLTDWPFELRSAVISATADPTPRTICWGPQHAFLYNEAFVTIFAASHPGALGQPIELIWRPGMREVIWPSMLSAYQGKTAKVDRLPLQLERDGFLEESYWDLTSTPIVGPDGNAIAVQNVLADCTRTIQSERRRTMMATLGKRIASAGTLTEVWSSFLSGLQCNDVDLPYATFYSAQHHHAELASNSTDSNVYTPENTMCTLEGTMGILKAGNLPQSFSLADNIEPDCLTPLRKSFTAAWLEQRPIVLSSEDGSLPSYLSLANPERGFGDTVKKAMILPITVITSRDLMGVLVVGLCPRVPFDEGYNMWLNIMGDVLVKSAAFISLPIEQRRAQKMADDINNSLAKQLQLTALQAERSDAKFSRMAKLAPLGMYILSPEGTPLYVNDAYRRLVPVLPDGSAVSFHNPSDWTKFIHPDDLCRFWASWEKVLVQKIPDICEYRILKERESGDRDSIDLSSDETWLLATSFPEVEADGRVSVIMGWITDISKQKAAERLLSQKLEDALETKRQSENFIDMTSHEMRNPLSSILLSADSIISSLRPNESISPGHERDLSSTVVEELVDAAHTIILCANFQKKIVDDILTLSKLDASLLEIAPDKVQVPQLVEKALRMFDTEITRAGIKTKLVIEPTYDALEVEWVVLDSSRLLQVVINLLTNAIKFTQFSDVRNITIYVGASYERPTGKHHGISFVPLRHTRSPSAPSSAWDDGEDVYLQVAVTDTGSGLDDEQIQVLFRRFAQASPKTYKQYGGSGLGLFISRELCELQGGQIGVSSSQDKTTFTFYVKAKRWIETDEEQPAMLTRFASNSSSPMAFTRRGSSILVHESDRRSASRERPRLDGTAEAASLPIPQITLSHDTDDVDHLHVLVVEDNLINQKVMAKQLRKAGLTVHVANHGLECLNFLSQSSYSSEPTTPQAEAPEGFIPTPLSIVLLDIEMPTMDGLTAIRHIRERQLRGEIVGHVPVIAVTANARSEQINSAIDAGMDEVVTKPFRIPELVPRMRKLVAEVLARI